MTGFEASWLPYTQQKTHDNYTHYIRSHVSDSSQTCVNAKVVLAWLHILPGQADS